MKQKTRMLDDQHSHKLALWRDYLTWHASAEPHQGKENKVKQY